MSEPGTVLPPATVELGQDEDDAWGAPPGPLCLICEHPVCPMCPVPWCDQMMGEDEYGSIACCDTDCTVDPIEFADWKQRACELMLGRDHRCNTPIDEHTCWTDQLGPYCPTWRRQVRGCTMCNAQRGQDAPRASYIATGASGLQWYECPEHDELDNFAEERRIRRELLCDWFLRLRAAYLAPRSPAAEIAIVEPLPGPDGMHFVAQFWGTPPKGEP